MLNEVPGQENNRQGGSCGLLAIVVKTKLSVNAHCNLLIKVDVSLRKLFSEYIDIYAFQNCHMDLLLL